jgi:hypothetical protein
MRTKTKQRIFLAVLAFLFLWAPTHYFLARRYHINHLRFAGFAMYARPVYVPYLQFSGRLRAGPLTPSALYQALGDESTKLADFRRDRQLWGEFQRPDEIGRLIFERMPELRELTITITSVGLEPGDDYLSTSVDRYRCARPRPGPERVCERF